MSRNPVINPPYDPPSRHWELNARGRWTQKLLDGRRKSGASPSVPSPLRRRAPKPPAQPHDRINRIRDEVSAWREAGWPGVSGAVRQLFEHWSGDAMEERPFFAQREAVETIVWLNEAGHHRRKFLAELAQVNKKWGGGLSRQCIKMATGTGKTRVMAMLALWLGVRDPRGRADILVITPNTTVRDRLEELDPNTNSGRALYRELLPGAVRMPRLRLVIANFHKFQRRTAVGFELTAVERAVISRYGTRKLKDKETRRQVLERMLGPSLGGRRRRFWVFNDEGHHCYAGDSAYGPENDETEEGRVWFRTLRAFQNEGGLDQIVDLSATPIFLTPPTGYSGELFPWTVSDYPLVEAAEAGLVKIPQVPVKDSTGEDEPRYRNIYKHSKPKRPSSPDAIDSFSKNLLNGIAKDWLTRERLYRERHHRVPPALIVVCSYIDVARAFYEYLGGRRVRGRWVPGLGPFSNICRDGKPVGEVRTLLVHSNMNDGERGETGLTSKKQVTQRALFQELRGGESLSNRELFESIRKMFLTVGKPGTVGARVRCVVSVLMLTEGWDARNVCQVFGFRAFESQLLCEQVTGRALRRSVFGQPDQRTGLFGPEYADVFGVPFDFMDVRANGPAPAPVAQILVETIPGREHLRIRFPHVARLLRRVPVGRVKLVPDRAERFHLGGADGPETTQMEGTLGPGDVMETGPFRSEPPVRAGTALWLVAREALTHFDGRESKRQMMSDLLRAVKQWVRLPAVGLRQDVFGSLGAEKNLARAGLAVAHACEAWESDETICPVFADDEPGEMSRWTDTSRRRFLAYPRHQWPAESDTDAVSARSELNVAVCDSGWEVIMARTLDTHSEIAAWTRNYGMGRGGKQKWRIPWYDEARGVWRSYEPDFVARTTSGVNLVVEVKGSADPNSQAKRRAAERWCQALSSSPDAGVWRYAYCTEPDRFGGTLTAVARDDRSQTGGNG